MIVLPRSFYVGDAAGRPNDHSDADIGFAKVWSHYSCMFFMFTLHTRGYMVVKCFC